MTIDSRFNGWPHSLNIMQYKSHTHPTLEEAGTSIAVALQSEADTSDALAVIAFAGEPASSADIYLQLPSLGAKPMAEVWRSHLPLLQGEYGPLKYRCNNDLLFGWLYLDTGDCVDMDVASYQAYRQILDFITRQGYPHLQRIWNYFADINMHQADGLNRYQAFCQGRHRALAEKPHYLQELPAATVIGTQTGGMAIYFIAAKEPGIGIENPRQVSAFNYPLQYGPQSPSFARALVKRWGQQVHLYISGTASIVGHESRHANDVPGQLDETLNNLGALVEIARENYGMAIHSPADFSLLKVYLRNADDNEEVSRHLSKAFGSLDNVLLLQGDVCRQELLLEIEGVYIADA